ncbi:hypothetical protein D3C87_2114220 [compost metagenome]
MIEAARQAGKSAGIFVSNSEDLERFSNQGIRFFILGSDQAVLRTGWTQQVRHFHSLIR